MFDFLKFHFGIDSAFERIIFALILAAGSHLFVILIKRLSRYLLSFSIARSYAKIKSLSGLITSFAIFLIYFGAVGIILREFGVSLTAYMASATVIGLAVGFGSQGLVQDVVTGLTLVFSNLLDVGDMVEIGGQAGIVRSIGMRFTVLENAMGAEVFIPNRSIINVINYPRGYVRCILDVALSADETINLQIKEVIQKSVNSIVEQFPGINIRPPTIEGKYETTTEKEFMRIKFRIWPGRGSPIETTLKQELFQRFKQMDPTYADWMVTAYYEVERELDFDKKGGRL